MVDWTANNIVFRSSRWPSNGGRSARHPLFWNIWDLEVYTTCKQPFLFSICLKSQDIIIKTLSTSNPGMLRSKFHIFEIDCSKIKWSIATTTQEHLITILTRYGMRTLPEGDLGRFGGLYKVLCITCKFWPTSSEKFCYIFEPFPIMP